MLGGIVFVVACATTSEAPRDLHFDSIVVDGHSDTTPRFEDPTWSFGTRHDAADGDMDLPRIREGGLDVQFWSIYMGKRESPGAAIREALERIDAVHEMAERYPERVIELAVKGMMPKNALGRAMRLKLKVYAGAAHPHQGQQPEPLKILTDEN